jgi:hypothetical protein
MQGSDQPFTRDTCCASPYFGRVKVHRVLLYFMTAPLALSMQRAVQVRACVLTMHDSACTIHDHVFNVSRVSHI